MKQFIVLTAVLPLILLLMIQLVYEQKNMATIQRVQQVIYGAKEEARLAGYFSQGLINETKEKLLEIEGVEEVSFTTAQKGPQERYSLGENRFIDYRVSLILKDVMAGAGFLLPKNKNKYEYVIEGYTPSEFIE